MHLRDRPPGVRDFLPHATLETAEVVRRMLAKDPLRRPSVTELVCWLAEIEIAELIVA